MACAVTMQSCVVCRIYHKEYEAIWVTADDVSEEGLLLSKHMLLDHLPDRTITVLSRALRRSEQQQRMQGHNGSGHTSEPPPAPATGSATGVQLPEIEVDTAAVQQDRLARVGSVTDVRSRQRSSPPAQ